MQLTVIVGIIIAIAGVAFALQNSVPVTLTFLLWRFDGSLAMVVLLSIALGALIIALVSTPSALRSRWSASRQRKEIESLKQANASLMERVTELERQSPAGVSSAESTGEPQSGSAVGLKAIAAQLGSSEQDSVRKG